MLETLKQWDRDIFIFLNNLGIERYDGFWLLVTQIETWTPLFILFIFLIFYYYKRKKGAVITAFLVFVFAVVLMITNLTKEYIARLRPNNVEELTELIRALQTPHNFSFFSGHSSSSFAITTFVVLMLRKQTKWIYLAYLWPILFIMSRIYVGVHYPSDILVGALVGTLIAFISYRLCQVALRRM